MISFIHKNVLSPFNKNKTQIKSSGYEIYKTKDSKLIHNKTLQKISQNFIFSDTSNLFNILDLTNSHEEIKKRQEFFKEIKKMGRIDNSFLRELKSPKEWWSPKYDIIVVTENTDTFSKLKEMGCPSKLILSEMDISLLEEKEIIQCIDCYEYSLAIESLPQSITFKNIEDVYLERHLEKFSGWIKNLEILKNKNLGEEANKIIENLSSIIPLTIDPQSKRLTQDEIEKKLETANRSIYEKIKSLSISGEELMLILSKGNIPENIKQIINETIEESNLPRQIIIPGMPLRLNEEELDRLLRRQSSEEFYNSAESIKSHSNELKKIPENLSKLSDYLIYYDFISGISKYLNEEMTFPNIESSLEIFNSKNIFLEKPKPISFNLKNNISCSILTGANSGGKTTLLEHIIQLYTLTQTGLPVSGEFKTPLFTEIYYFAKNKGSASKGAFETLLTQMSCIKPGNQTLILADEIEAVTEPGVAGNIIAATADYFIDKNCFLIIATHLGYEIEKVLPHKTRIDGIEARGLTEDFELIVDHNPILGKLANSTPELIVEKMANSEKKEYFIFLNNFLNNFLKNKS